LPSLARAGAPRRDRPDAFGKWNRFLQRRAHARLGKNAGSGSPCSRSRQSARLQSPDRHHPGIGCAGGHSASIHQPIPPPRDCSAPVDKDPGERLFNRIEQFRRIARRDDNLDRRDEAFVTADAILIQLA
jgi:hypothetical protein